MQHDEAVQTLAVERYLLGDMNTSELEHFEEHLFTCPECAESMKMGAVFADNAREVFRDAVPRAEPEAVRQFASWKPTPWWKRLMLPAFAPALAIVALCYVAGYQQFVVISGLRNQLSEVTAPQPIASFALHAPSRGAEQPIIVPRNARFFDLYFDVAVESTSGYSCAIQSSSGSIIFREHLPPPGPEAGGAVTLLIGRSRLPAGDYTLIVSAEPVGTVEVGRYPFKVEYQ